MVVAEEWSQWQSQFLLWLDEWEKSKETSYAWSASEVQARANGEACGFVEAGRLTSVIFFRRVGTLVEIDFLGTLASWRGKGQMRALFYFLQNQQNIEKIWLEVHEKNDPAIQFYQKMGMKKVGERPRYYPGGFRCFLYSWEK